MSLEEIQLIASIVSDLTMVSMVTIAIIYVERRRVFLAQEILDDWKDMKIERMRRFDTPLNQPGKNVDI